MSTEARVFTASKAVLCALCLSGVLAGCEAPVVGEWQSDKRLENGEKNALHVQADYTGSATIYATPVYDLGAWVKLKFEFEWEDEVEEFDFQLECVSSNCSANDDFKMECVAIRDDEGNDKLDCDGNGNWDRYPFNWERDEN